MISTPKSRFLLNTEFTRRWNDLTDSPDFQAVLDTALLELISTQRVGNQVYDAQAMAHRIDGAKAVLRILQTLGQKPEPQERVRPTDLERDETKVPGHLDPEFYRVKPSTT